MCELAQDLDFLPIKLGGSTFTAEDIFANAKSKNYYMLAAQLLAAKLNMAQLGQILDLEYEDFDCVVDAIEEADGILTELFVNNDDYSKRLPKSARAEVNELKDILDAFNNNECGTYDCPCAGD